MTIRATLTLAAFLGFTGVISADQQEDHDASGNGLLEDCKAFLDDDSPHRVRAGECIGYISGLTSMHDIYSQLSANGRLFCIPSDGVERGQVVRIVVKFLEDHPEKLHESKAFLAINAMKSAFPCPKDARFGSSPVPKFEAPRQSVPRAAGTPEPESQP
jgi:hypothetical protein